MSYDPQEDIDRFMESLDNFLERTDEYVETMKSMADSQDYFGMAALTERLYVASEMIVRTLITIEMTVNGEEQLKRKILMHGMKNGGWFN